MLRSKMGLALGGAAAIAVGIFGGWTLVARPVQARAPAIETASIMITTSAPSTEEATPSGPAPVRTATPNPAPAATPARTTQAPPAATPTPNAAPADGPRNKPRIRLDGERSEISFDGDKGSLRVNKDKLSVRTPFGKFDLDW